MRFDSEEVESLLTQADTEIARLTAEAEEASRRIDALVKFKEGLRVLSPGFPTEDHSVAVAEELQGMDAVLAVFHDNEGQWLTTEDFLSHYRQRGWLAESPNPMGTIRVNLREVRKRFADNIEQREDPRDKRALQFRWKSEMSEGPSM